MNVGIKWVIKIFDGSVSILIVKLHKIWEAIQIKGSESFWNTRKNVEVYIGFQKKTNEEKLDFLLNIKTESVAIMIY